MSLRLRWNSLMVGSRPQDTCTYLKFSRVWGCTTFIYALCSMFELFIIYCLSWNSSFWGRLIGLSEDFSYRTHFGLSFLSLWDRIWKDKWFIYKTSSSKCYELFTMRRLDHTRASRHATARQRCHTRAASTWCVHVREPNLLLLSNSLFDFDQVVLTNSFWPIPFDYFSNLQDAWIGRNYSLATADHEIVLLDYRRS